MKLAPIAKFLSISLFVFKSLNTVNAQGTIMLNNPWINDGLGGFSLVYFDGFSFRIGNRTPPFESPVHVGAIGPAGYPHNGTPFAAFINTLGTPQYVLFARTNAARFGDYWFSWGAPFGLISVDLADPIAPSPEAIQITFNGFRADGSMVSQTFTVGGGGSSSFQTFYFGPEFAHGLVRVEIPSPRWAMDNIVWIPEPSPYALLGLGLLAIGWRGIQQRWKL